MKKITLTAAAASSNAWRVFATGTDSSTYGAFTNASADAPGSHALAIRATSSPGKTIKVSMFITCQAEATVKSGAILVATTYAFQKCSLNGSANTDYSSRVKIELLRR